MLVVEQGELLILMSEAPWELFKSRLPPVDFFEDMPAL